MASQRRGGTTTAFLAMLLVLGLVAAACGGGDETSAADDDTPGQEPEAAADADGADAGELSLTIGGSGSGGGAFIAGGTLAEYVNQAEELPHIDVTNQSTAGFVENIRLLASNELDLGMVSTNLMTNALKSEKAFEGEEGFEDIRIMFAIWPQYGVAGTYSDDIQTIEDLEGRPVNVGPGGSATQEVARGLLGGAGIMDSVEMDQQDWAEGVRLMQDGLVDAFFIMGPAPFPAIQEAAAAPGQNFRLLDTSGAAAGALEQFPEFVPIDTPANVHGEGLPEDDMPTIGAVGYLATTSELSEEAVYELTSSLLGDEGQEYLINGYAGFDFEILPSFDPLVTLADNDVVVPLHPGAVRYWEEQGEDIPDVLMP